MIRRVRMAKLPARNIKRDSVRPGATPAPMGRQRSQPGGLGPARILQMQRSLGNRASGQMIATISPRPSALALSIQRALTDHTDYAAGHVAALPTIEAQRAYIRSKLGPGTEVEKAIDDLYFEAYWERMGDKTSEHVGRWWNRFKVFEQLRSEWHTFLATDFTLEAFQTQWDKLQTAYDRLEDRAALLVGNAAGPSPLARQVYNDMKSQFRRWDGARTNRGAWWGSPRPGDPSGATRVPDGVIQELRQMIRASAWRFEGSLSGELSFHRTSGGIDFIYHMFPPA